MSIKRMSAVWDYSRAKGSHLLLLLAIADHANDNGFAWPGSSRLADKTRMSTRHVHRMIKDLVNCGELYSEQLELGENNRYIVLVGLSDTEICQILAFNFKKTPAEVTQALNEILAAKKSSSDKLSLPRKSSGDNLSLLPRKSSSDKLSLGSDSCVTTQPSINVKEEEEEGHNGIVNTSEIIPALKQYDKGFNSEEGQYAFIPKKSRPLAATTYVEVDEGGEELTDLGKEAFANRLWNATLSAKLSGSRPKLSGSQQQTVDSIYRQMQKNAEYAEFVAHQIDWCKNAGSPIVGIRKFLVLLVSPDTFAKWKGDKSYNVVGITSVTKGAVPLSRNSDELKPMIESFSDEFDPVWDKYIKQQEDGN